MLKTCDICNTEFEGRPNKIRCSEACKREAQRILAADKYAEDPSVQIRRSAEWRARNPEGSRAASRAWERRNPEAHEVIVRKSNQARRAAKLNAESDGLPYVLEDCCIICYATENLTEEHMIALANGGTDTLGNKTTMCQSCNSSKGTRIDYTSPEYIPWLVRRRLG